MPIYTNRKGLSQAWVRAAEMADDAYDRAGWRSLTNIIDSPRIRLLEERHDSEIITDVSDTVFAILGSAVHGILEISAEPNVITEYRIVVPVLTKEISMKADRIEPIHGTTPQEYHLKDYKITKVWAFKNGPKSQQIAQANGYRWGYNRSLKLNITKASLEMILKDWSSLEAETKQTYDYPDAEVQSVLMPIWELQEAQQYLEKRVELFMQCEGMADDELPFCTADERWERPPKWAFKKKSNPRAIRVFSTEEEAQAMMSAKGTGEHEVELRAGESVRCRHYCRVCRWCRQYRDTIQQNEKDAF